MSGAGLVPERVNLGLALKVINAMIRFARDNDLPAGSYAVVDEGGHVVGFERRDPAPPATADIAIDKAWTAATMRVSGRMLEVITRGQAWRLNVKHKGRLTIIPGAIPIIARARVIGGIGHSGASAEDDLRIAQAGLAAVYREEGFREEVEPQLALARRIAGEAIKIISEGGLRPSSVAVTDPWGELVLLYRMDGAPPGTLELARDKAWTAAAFRAPSGHVEALYGKPPAVNWNERLTTIPGGVPFARGGELLGALGVAGNRPAEDEEIALKTLKALGLEALEPQPG